MEWTLFDWVTQITGFIGCLMVSIPFLLGSSLGYEKWAPDTWLFIASNFAGSMLLTVSLYYHFNLGSFAIEVFWITGGIISIRKKLAKA